LSHTETAPANYKSKMTPQIECPILLRLCHMRKVGFLFCSSFWRRIGVPGQLAGWGERQNLRICLRLCPCHSERSKESLYLPLCVSPVLLTRRARISVFVSVFALVILSAGGWPRSEMTPRNRVPHPNGCLIAVRVGFHSHEWTVSPVILTRRARISLTASSVCRSLFPVPYSLSFGCL